MKGSKKLYARGRRKKSRDRETAGGSRHCLGENAVASIFSSHRARHGGGGGGGEAIRPQLGLFIYRIRSSEQREPSKGKPPSPLSPRLFLLGLRLRERFSRRRWVQFSRRTYIPASSPALIVHRFKPFSRFTVSSLFRFPRIENISISRIQSQGN